MTMVMVMVMVVKTDDDQWSQSPPCQCGGRGTSVRGACRHLASSHNPSFVIRSYRYELFYSPPPRCPRDSSGR